MSREVLSELLNMFQPSDIDNMNKATACEHIQKQLWLIRKTLLGQSNELLYDINIDEDEHLNIRSHWHSASIKYISNILTVHSLTVRILH